MQVVARKKVFSLKSFLILAEIVKKERENREIQFIIKRDKTWENYLKH